MAVRACGNPKSKMASQAAQAPRAVDVADAHERVAVGVVLEERAGGILRAGTEDGGRRTEDGGRWTVDGGRRTEDGGRLTPSLSPRPERSKVEGAFNA